LPQTREWEGQDSQVLVQVDQGLPVQAVLLLDQVLLVPLELEGRLELVPLAQVEQVLQAELQVSVVQVEDQVPEVAVVAAEQPVLLVRVVLETHLRLESQRERNVKNSNYVQRLALVEQLFHAVMEILSFVFVVVHQFKTLQTRLMPMLAS
jgi:hypothetical protein